MMFAVALALWLHFGAGLVLPWWLWCLLVLQGVAKLSLQVAEKKRAKVVDALIEWSNNHSRSGRLQ